MTVLLDTNAVSELMRKSPDPAVVAWVATCPLEDLFFSAVGEAELRYGAAILPEGRRRETLVSDIEAMLRDAFEDRVLPFDSAAARGRTSRRAGGLPDRGDRAVPQHGGGDAQRSRLRGHGNRGRRSLDRGREERPGTSPRRGAGSSNCSCASRFSSPSSRSTGSGAGPSAKH